MPTDRCWVNPDPPSARRTLEISHQQPSVDFEKLGGFGLVAVGGIHGALDQGFSNVSMQALQPSSRGARSAQPRGVDSNLVCKSMSGSSIIPARASTRALDYVFKFANITWPVTGA